MSSKPDIVINKGNLSKNIFRFDNNGYTYTVDKANKKLQFTMEKPFVTKH